MDFSLYAKAKEKRYLLNLGNLQSSDGTPLDMASMLQVLLFKLFSGETPCYRGVVTTQKGQAFWEVADKWAKKALVDIGGSLSQCIDDTPQLVMCSNGENFAQCTFVQTGTYSSWGGKDLRVGGVSGSSTILYGQNMYTLNLFISRTDIDSALYDALLVDNGQVLPDD